MIWAKFAEWKVGTVIIGKQGAAKQSQCHRAAKSTHEARANSYFNQHSFYADDLPYRRRTHDL